MKHTILMVGGALMLATVWATAQTETPGATEPTVAELTAQNQILRRHAGLTPLFGAGVVLELRDNAGATTGKFPNAPTDAMVGIVHDYDVLSAVNALRAAGAEAIAVNGIRLGTQTAISVAGPTILVGEQKIVIPVKIEAIGNPVALSKAANGAYGFLNYLKSTGLEVTSARAAKLQLPALKETPVFRYASPQ